MCHSLVGGGAGEGRLLLVGGRKRDGICAESWWLNMVRGGRGSVGGVGGGGKGTRGQGE